MGWIICCLGRQCADFPGSKYNRGWVDNQDNLDYLDNSNFYSTVDYMDYMDHVGSVGYMDYGAVVQTGW
jgi:hypothetical protein